MLFHICPLCSLKERHKIKEASVGNLSAQEIPSPSAYPQQGECIKLANNLVLRVLKPLLFLTFQVLNQAVNETGPSIKITLIGACCLHRTVLRLECGHAFILFLPSICATLTRTLCPLATLFSSFLFSLSNFVSDNGSWTSNA